MTKWMWFAVAVSAAGCQKEATTPGPDPCALGREAAAKILGAGASEEATGAACEFTKTGEPGKVVLLAAAYGDARGRPLATMEDHKIARRKRATALPNLGDEGWTVSGSSVTEVFAWKKNTLVSLASYQGSGDVAMLEKEVRAILDRLPNGGE